MINSLSVEFPNTATLNSDSARKNAAVCLAKLAKKKEYLELIRELRGLEMMISYAKKLI